MNPDLDDSYLLTDNWNEFCNINLSHYSKYIKQAEIEEYAGQLILIDREAGMKEYIRRYGKNEYYTPDTFLTTEPGVRKKIMSYLIAQNLIGLKYRRRKEWDPLISAYMYQYTFFCYPLKTVMYYIEWGSQTRNFKHEFYDKVNKEIFLWGDFATFQYAYDSIYTGGTEDDFYHFLKAEFKRDFIDSFEIGRSLLMVC